MAKCKNDEIGNKRQQLMTAFTLKRSAIACNMFLFSLHSVLLCGKSPCVSFVYFVFLLFLCFLVLCSAAVISLWRQLELLLCALLFVSALCFCLRWQDLNERGKCKHCSVFACCAIATHKNKSRMQLPCIFGALNSF